MIFGKFKQHDLLKPKFNSILCKIFLYACYIKEATNNFCNGISFLKHGCFQYKVTNERETNYFFPDIYNLVAKKKQIEMR
jgi:hypothetical protein